MKKIAIDKPALSFAIAVIGLVGAGVVSPTMAMINASPDFYDLYRMSTWAVLVFVLLTCIALPILSGMVAYIFASSQTIQWGLPLYFISLAGVAAAASIRNFVPISEPWLLVFISSMLGVLIYVAFRHLTIVRVCLIASSVALPLTMAQSISVVSNRITNSEEMSSPLLPLTPQGRLPDIVFLQLDELPLTTLLDSTGEINRNLFPNFYALASTSHRFSSMGTNYCNTR